MQVEAVGEGILQIIVQEGTKNEEGEMPESPLERKMFLEGILKESGMKDLRG